MKALVLSISSDIGLELVKSLEKKGYEVYGTYSTTLPNLEHLNSRNFFKLDIKNYNSENFKKWLSRIKCWDLFISCIGTLKPVGKFSDIDPQDWVDGVSNNSLYQIGALLNAIPYRNKEIISTVIFFAGSGTNSATPFYSAYTLGKISLIKSVELLDSEYEDLKISILGPGWVKTKIHESTIKAATNAGENYQKTIKILKEPKKLNTIKKVIDDIYKLISLPKYLISGRNFSSVHDIIEKDNLERLYRLDKDFYKIRRKCNDQ